MYLKWVSHISYPQYLTLVYLVLKDFFSSKIVSERTLKLYIHSGSSVNYHPWLHPPGGIYCDWLVMDPNLTIALTMA